MNLSAYEILKAVKGKNISLSSKNLKDITISSISIDSRNLEANSLYIPIKGDNFDGHRFISDSFKKGASICLSHETIKVEKDQIIIKVKDTKKALADLAAYYRSKFTIPVIGITGSVGKTSTKDLLAASLSSKYKVHKTKGNFNNDIGLPLTIFGLRNEHEVMVVEMGMNNFGEIKNLANISKPDIGIITNIGTSHIENLKSQEGILRAKCEIIDGIKPDGLLIVSGDDKMLKSISKDDIQQRLIKCGLNKDNDYIGSDIETIGTKCIKANIKGPDIDIDIKINALGKHTIKNGIMAVAAAKELGLSTSEIISGLKSYKSDNMRMNLMETPSGIRLINDTYNASPDSMKAAIRTVASINNEGRKILILGDMLEMGSFSSKLHESVGKFIALKKEFDFLITVGDFSTEIQRAAIKNGFNQKRTRHYTKQEELIKDFPNIVKKGDLVLVKASRSLELEKTVEEIRKWKGES